MTIVFYSHKGGVSKTTLAVHVAFRAMEKGRELTYIDTDKQQNSMSWLAGHEWDGEEYSKGSVRVTADVESGLSSPGLVLVDAPPEWEFMENFGKMNVDVDIWIVPINGRFSLDGAMTVIRKVKALGKGRVVLVPSMVDPTTAFGKYEIENAKGLGVELFRFAIPRHEIIRRAEMQGLPTWSVPYGVRATATQNIQLFADWCLAGCPAKGTYGNDAPNKVRRYEVQ